MQSTIESILSNMNRSAQNQRTTSQLIRYIIVGIVNNSITTLIYLVVTHFGVSPGLALTVLYGVTAVAGFYGNRRLTFHHTGRLSTSGGRYIVVYSLVFVFMQLALVVFYQWLGFPHQIVTIVTTCALIPVMFVAMKYFVFVERTS
jgi:putative flippase GtrA